MQVSDNRIDGIIEVARTLGDFQLSHLKHLDGAAGALSAEPELRKHQLLEEDEFLILASDGFWKMHSSNEAAIKEARRRLRKQLSPRAVADELVGALPESTHLEILMPHQSAGKSCADLLMTPVRQLLAWMTLLSWPLACDS